MPDFKTRITKLAYLAILAAVSLWVLAAFLTPSARHSGLNLYEETRFPAMVQGTAHTPFVYRTLLPTTVRLLTAATPTAWSRELDGFTERNPRLRRIFDILGWEYSGSIKYYFAALLMWVSLVGFAHFTTALTCRQLEWPASVAWRTALGSAALLGLPAFFKYSSFPYDPPQLFLFAAALYLLAAGRFRAFLPIFVLCCLNKETAVLLIPVFLWCRRDQAPGSRALRETGLLLVVFVVIKAGLTWVFRDNPGSFVEFHLVDHNLPWLLGGWSAFEVVLILVLAALMIVRWRDKPRFLRMALVAILPAQLCLALFLGFIDEWRMYYEAYPAVFGLSVATLRLFIRDCS